jgi:small nuclear ribonucleoprotein (snRNP)-like protein
MAARNDNGEKFAAHVFNTPNFSQTDKLIPLEIKGNPGLYSLSANQLASFDQNLNFILEDKYTGSKTKLVDGLAVPVEVSEDPASRGEDRFVLRITSKEIGLNAEPTLSLYPNPANSGFVKLFTGSKLKGILQVYSVYGALSMEYNNLISENGVQQIDVNTLAAGVYTVVWNDGMNRLTAKLVKQ